MQWQSRPVLRWIECSMLNCRRMSRMVRMQSATRPLLIFLLPSCFTYRYWLFLLGFFCAHWSFILSLRLKHGVIVFFQYCQCSGRREASFELLLTTICSGLYHDGHKPWRPQTMTMTVTAMKTWKTNARRTVKLILYRWINFAKMVIMVSGHHGRGRHMVIVCGLLWPSLSNPICLQASLVWSWDLQIENALGMKNWENRPSRGGVIGFWPITKLILLFGFQTMVRSFIKIDWELNWLRISAVGQITDGNTDTNALSLWYCHYCAIAMKQIITAAVCYVFQRWVLHVRRWTLCWRDARHTKRLSRRHQSTNRLSYRHQSLQNRLSWRHQSANRLSQRHQSATRLSWRYQSTNRLCQRRHSLQTVRFGWTICHSSPPVWKSRASSIALVSSS